MRGLAQHLAVRALGVERVVGFGGDAALDHVALDALALRVVAVEDLGAGVADGQQAVV